MKFARIFIMAAVACMAAGCAGGGVKDAALPANAAPEARDDGETREACREAIRRARTDARGGRYRMYVFGKERYEPRFARFLAEYMKNRHGIDLVLSEPGDPARSRCYSNEMDKIILNTFGPDVLADAEQAAGEIFDPQH